MLLKPNTVFEVDESKTPSSKKNVDTKSPLGVIKPKAMKKRKGEGGAIPRRISFLEELRSRGISILHSSGIEEDEIYSLGSSRNFEELFYL